MRPWRRGQPRSWPPGRAQLPQGDPSCPLTAVGSAPQAPWVSVVSPHPAPCVKTVMVTLLLPAPWLLRLVAPVSTMEGWEVPHSSARHRAGGGLGRLLPAIMGVPTSSNPAHAVLPPRAHCAHWSGWMTPCSTSCTRQLLGSGSPSPLCCEVGAQGAKAGEGLQVLQSCPPWHRLVLVTMAHILRSTLSILGGPAG